MKIWTYQEAETKVRKDLDLQDEDNFIGNDEMAGLFNDAIDEAEAEIMKLSEDYFLTSTPLTLIPGTANYDLPADIYAQKIRELIYANGPLIYPINRVRDPQKFFKKAESDYYGNGGTNEYSYMLKSPTAGAQDKLVLTPTPQESGAYLELWYIRNANRIPMVGEVVSGVTTTRTIQLAKTIDIPEHMNFIFQFVKVQCLMKDKANDVLPGETAKLIALKKSMVEALTNRVPDNDDTVPPDMSFYEEHN